MKALLTKRVLAATVLLVLGWFARPVAAECCSGGFGWDPRYWFYDGHTRCMWHRTWHGPNALATPLRQYYIPRTYAYCCCNGYGGPCCHEMCELEAAPVETARVGFEPVQFERLGQIPNELDLAGQIPGAAAPRH
jgi:hypothetical protein